MAEKLSVQGNKNVAGKKLWDIHQGNEYTRVNNYKEGMCFMCFKKKAVGATIIDICSKCCEKKGVETTLAFIKDKMYGFCFECGTYQFKIFNMNVRICESCYTRLRRHLKELRQKGIHGVDPFWKSMRRRLGKDYQILMSNGTKSYKYL